MVPQVISYCVTVGKMTEVALETNQKHNHFYHPVKIIFSLWLNDVGYRNSSQQVVLAAHQKSHIRLLCQQKYRQTYTETLDKDRL